MSFIAACGLAMVMCFVVPMAIRKADPNWIGSAIVMGLLSIGLFLDAAAEQIAKAIKESKK